MSEIALFPLSSVLLPSGRMSLQIFEQRYLDLVAHCMRESEVSALCGYSRGRKYREGHSIPLMSASTAPMPGLSTGISSQWSARHHH